MANKTKYADDHVIVLLPKARNAKGGKANWKRDGSASAHIVACYRHGQTVGQFRKALTKAQKDGKAPKSATVPGCLGWDGKRGYLAVVPANKAAEYDAKTGQHVGKPSKAEAQTSANANAGDQPAAS